MTPTPEELDRRHEAIFGETRRPDDPLVIVAGDYVSISQSELSALRLSLEAAEKNRKDAEESRDYHQSCARSLSHMLSDLRVELEATRGDIAHLQAVIHGVSTDVVEAHTERDAAHAKLAGAREAIEREMREMSPLSVGYKRFAQALAALVEGGAGE